MVTQTGTPKPSPRRQVVAAIGTALALGVVAGLSAWQLGAHGHRGSQPTSTAVQAHVQQQPVTQASPLPTAAAAHAVPERGNVLYLVNSDAAADQFRASLAAISDPMLANDAAISVVPADAPDQLTVMLQILNAANQERSRQGLPPVQLVDLR